MDDDTLDDTLDNGSFASTTTTVTTSCTDSNLNNPLQSWLDRTDHASLGLWSASSVARVESPRDPHRTEPAPASSVADSDNESTFWQSGPGIQVPHWLVVRFPRVIHLSLVVVSLNMALDGAMTPSDVEVLAGYSPMSLVSVGRSAPPASDSDDPGPAMLISITSSDGEVPNGIPCSIVKLVFHGNWGGDEVRVRAIKLLGPPSSSPAPAAMDKSSDLGSMDTSSAPLHVPLQPGSVIAHSLPPHSFQRQR